MTKLSTVSMFMESHTAQKSVLESTLADLPYSVVLLFHHQFSVSFEHTQPAGQEDTPTIKIKFVDSAPIIETRNTDSLCMVATLLWQKTGIERVIAITSEKKIMLQYVDRNGNVSWELQTYSEG